MLLAVLLSVTACANPVPMESADDANNPACATVTVRLPSYVDGQARRETNAQATGAWGTPANVLLRCGIPSSGPTALPCLNVNGVDWIRDDTNAPLYRFEAYGREPGLEVIIDADATPAVSGTNVLVDLGDAVSTLPQPRKCLSLTDSYEF